MKIYFSSEGIIMVKKTKTETRYTKPNIPLGASTEIDIHKQ